MRPVIAKIVVIYESLTVWKDTTVTFLRFSCKILPEILRKTTKTRVSLVDQRVEHGNLYEERNFRF
jgi:hypothetical protein